MKTMNMSCPTQKKNRFVSFLLLALVWGVTNLSYGKTTGKEEKVYFVIKPGLSKELLTKIAERLKSKNVTVTYPQLSFESGRLHSITVQIEVDIPGKSKRTYTLSQTAHAGAFEPLVFYCLSDGKRIGFVKEKSTELTSEEKKIANKNLNGLLITQNGNQEVIGHWQSN